MEDKDSHARAIAGCIHGIYGGMENILKNLISHFDHVLPAGEDWHAQLLCRAKYPNEGVRPAIISEKSFVSLDFIMGFCQIFGGKYHTNLIPKLILERADELLKAYPDFLKGIKSFQASIEEQKEQREVRVPTRTRQKGPGE